MSRLEKKCFIASGGFHLLLMVILVVGPAFLSSRNKSESLEVLDIIPANIVEGMIRGGGNPNPQPTAPAPPPQPQAQPQAQVTPPQPQPEVQVPEKTEPPKDTPKLNKRDPDAVEPAKDSKPKKDPFKEVVRKNATNAPKKNSAADAQAKELAATQKRNATEVSRVVRNLRNSLSSGTAVELPTGPGGDAYAGYDLIIQSIYQKKYDETLLAAGDIAEGYAEASASVTVERNGNVLSARISNPSGNPRLNKVLQRVLDNVRFIAPFPETSKDGQRTFEIIFDLKPKRGTG